MPLELCKSKGRTVASFARVWNTHTNHGQAPERRVCVISGKIIMDDSHFRVGQEYGRVVRIMFKDPSQWVWGVGLTQQID